MRREEAALVVHQQLVEFGGDANLRAAQTVGDGGQDARERFLPRLPPRRTLSGGSCQTLRTDSSRIVASPRPKGARLAWAMIWRTCASGTGKDKVPMPATSTRGSAVSKAASTKKSPGRRTPREQFFQLLQITVVRNVDTVVSVGHVQQATASLRRGQGTNGFCQGLLICWQVEADAR